MLPVSESSMVTEDSNPETQLREDPVWSLFEPPTRNISDPFASSEEDDDIVSLDASSDRLRRARRCSSLIELLGSLNAPPGSPPLPSMVALRLSRVSFERLHLLCNPSIPQLSPSNPSFVEFSDDPGVKFPIGSADGDLAQFLFSLYTQVQATDLEVVFSLFLVQRLVSRHPLLPLSINNIHRISFTSLVSGAMILDICRSVSVNQRSFLRDAQSSVEKRLTARLEKEKRDMERRSLEISPSLSSSLHHSLRSRLKNKRSTSDLDDARMRLDGKASWNEPIASSFPKSTITDICASCPVCSMSPSVKYRHITRTETVRSSAMISSEIDLDVEDECICNGHHSNRESFLHEDAFLKHSFSSKTMFPSSYASSTENLSGDRSTRIHHDSSCLRSSRGDSDRIESIGTTSPNSFASSHHEDASHEFLSLNRSGFITSHRGIRTERSYESDSHINIMLDSIWWSRWRVNATKPWWKHAGDTDPELPAEELLHGLPHVRRIVEEFLWLVGFKDLTLNVTFAMSPELESFSCIPEWDSFFVSNILPHLLFLSQ